MSDDKLLEAWKVARNSVEHFDKIIGVFRQIIFTFDGIFISSFAAFYINKFFEVKIIDPAISTASSEKIYAVLFFSSIVFAAINYLVWTLEKHYHKYLIIAAETANSFEKDLFPNKVNERLTYRLNLVHQKSKSEIINFISYLFKSYNLLYLVPILAVASMSNFLLEHTFERFNGSFIFRFGDWFSLIFLFLSFQLLFVNFQFERKHKLLE